MARVLLVSYTHARSDRVLHMVRRLAPALHLELGGTDRPPSRTAKTASDLLSPEVRDQIVHHGISWLKQIPRTAVGERNLAEHLEHRSVSLWWWLESPIWFGRPADPTSPPMSKLLEACEALKFIMESTTFDRVVFTSDIRPMASLLVRDVASHFGLEVSGPTPGPTASWLTDAVRPLAIRWVLLRRRKLGPRVRGGQGPILLVSHLNALRRVGEARHDVYLGPLHEELNRRGVPHALCYVNTAADSNPSLRPMSPSLPDGGFLLEQAISDRPAGELARAYRGLVESWERIAPRALEAMAWRGTPLPRTLRARLGDAVRRHAPTGVYYLAAFEELLDAMRPRLVVVTNETGYAGRAVVAACRRGSVPSVGVQHGLITPQHIEYINDPVSMDRGLPWSCPNPDLTALDGEYYRRVLLEVGAYPRDSLVVTGQMRYEAGDDRVSDPVGRDPRRIVVATHPFDREVWITDVVEACRDLGDLVIKPHPLEDTRFYADFVRTRAAKTRVVDDIDLMRLLRSAGALVTGFSTTVVEAAVSGCPSIVYNPWRTSPPVPFADAGGAMVAESKDDLRRAVRAVLGDPATRRSLEETRHAFLTQFAYGGGTGSARRLADELLRRIGG